MTIGLVCRLMVARAAAEVEGRDGMASVGASEGKIPSGEPVVIPAEGACLAGRVFRGAGTASAAVVLHGATGIPQRFYRSFAAWLAEQHRSVVLTYDHRDFGASATGPVRRSRATMADWGVRDQAAAMDWIMDAHPDLPVDVVGHSLGGLMLPFHPNADRVRRAVIVASGPAHWRRHPARYKPLVMFFWFGGGPALTAAMGYLPGRLMGFGADLPAGVYWQWRRWCTHPRFYEPDYGRALPEPRPERVTARIAFVGVADDVMMPPERVEALQRYYLAAERSFAVLEPSAAGLPALGHLGAFARRNAAAWPHVMQSWDASTEGAEATTTGVVRDERAASVRPGS